MKKIDFYREVMSYDLLKFNTSETQKLHDFYADDTIDENIRATDGFIIIEEDDVKSNPYIKIAGIDGKLLVGICFHVTPYLKKINANKHLKNEEIYEGLREWRYFRVFVHPFPTDLSSINEVIEGDYADAEAEFEDCVEERAEIAEEK